MRRVGLVAGSQIEGLALVLAVFFASMALGTRFLGPRADDFPSPLRFYAALEAGAATWALIATAALDGLDVAPVGRLRLLGAALAIAPTPFLLGATLPALVRSAARDPSEAGSAAGRLSALNTASAVAGVGLAAVGMPSIGLRASVAGAAGFGLAIAALAFGWSRGERLGEAPGEAEIRDLPGEDESARRWAIAAAALAGVSTLAFQVLAARGAALRLGSTLAAWAIVLGLFLASLALGNALGARLAARSEDGRSSGAARSLVQVQWIAVLGLCAAAALLAPGAATPARGVDALSVLLVVASVAPAATCMGMAFPLFVRLGAGGRPIARGVSRVAAFNTAGGVLGAALAPFLVLPFAGLQVGIALCALANAAIAIGFSLGLPDRRGAGGRALVFAVVAFAILATPRLPDSDSANVLFVSHGRQATAAVLERGEDRMLVVDGDPEAGTGRATRETEELIAILPLLLHPDARDLLEVGLGAGITLSSAAQFPLERIRCIEIAESVIEAAPLFAAATGRVLHDERVDVVRGDGRSALLGFRASQDVVLANTIHPWSLGATGLYSREYFERVRDALRDGGVAAQWIPLERIGEERSAAIARTLLTTFEHGTLWWGRDNLVVVGSLEPTGDPRERIIDAARRPRIARALETLGHSPRALSQRWLGDFATARAVLGAGAVLSDDRPWLERPGLHSHSETGPELAWVRQLAKRAGAHEGLQAWIASRRPSTDSETEAPALMRAAEDAGLEVARVERVAGVLGRVRQAVLRGQTEEARALLRGIEDDRRGLPGELDREWARSLAAIAVASGSKPRLRSAARALESLTDGAGASFVWNDLGLIRSTLRDDEGALEAFRRAVETDPAARSALANRGLLALQKGLRDEALEAEAALSALAPLADPPELRALREALRAD